MPTLTTSLAASATLPPVSVVSTTAAAAAATGAPNAFIASPEVLRAYIGLQFVGGQLLLPLLVITFLLSRSVMRHPVLTNFLICWSISALGGCFLFYAGQASGPQPSEAVCLTQVTFTYGAPVLCAVGGLCLVIKFLYDFRPKKFSPAGERRFFTFLLILPYVFGLTFGILALVNGATHTGGLTRTFLLCELSSAADTFSLPATICLVMAIALILVGEAMIAWKIWQFRRHSKVRNEDGRIMTGVPMSFYIRMGIFTMFSFLALPTAFTYQTSTANAVSYLLQATIPLACFLVFGTQLDVLRVWAFWSYTENGTTSYAFWRGGKGGGDDSEKGGKGINNQTVSVANSEMTMVASGDAYGNAEKGYGGYTSHKKTPSSQSGSGRSSPEMYAPSPMSRGPSLRVPDAAGNDGPLRPQNSVHLQHQQQHQHTRSLSRSQSPVPSRVASPAPGMGHVRTLTPTVVYNPNRI